MTKIKHIIDFEIIWKKIHSSLSDKEEEMLDGWLMENRKHQKFFEKAKRYYAEGSAYNKMPADSNKSLRKVFSQINASQKARSLKRLTYYSTIAASILIIVGLYILLPREDKFPSIAESEYQIEPGTQKAQLILDDGSAYDLSSDKELSIQEEGAQINSKGTSVQYTKDKTLFAKLKYNTLKVPRGGEYVLDLSDGTRVWLNSETTIKYPVQFVGKERNVELIGEAYFEVARNEKKPFKVLSGGQVVEVLGTSFNISSYVEEMFVTTTLVEGRVNVFLKDRPDENQILLPNSQSNLNKNENRISQRKVDVEKYIAWKDGRFYFKDQTLGEMMKTLSRWYDVTVSFADENAKEIQFTGDLERYENFEKILSLIEKTNEVNFTIEGKSVIIE